ncbi:MAG: nucleotidyltransferase family protein [Clostridia bacterium]|nr:nucleotidyltransferase family protein [Clostridia bacterium]
MVHCILLAAGFSVRYGSDKRTDLVDGIPMYRHTADILLRLAEEGLCTARMVTRGDLPADPGIKIILNPAAKEGIASSVRAGILSLPDDGAPAAFFTADQPYLKEETVRGLLRAWPECGHGILRCESGGVPGSPVLFDRRYFPELLALRGDTGGRKVIRAHPEDLALYHVPDGKELTDIDEKQN